ncbi:MAG: helix-turn-helix domain-containing protein [Methanomicrobiales archaeon]|nr:helix-turn-helix domain-containing protein [Methanomicrobiales archaeon]
MTLHESEKVEFKETFDRDTIITASAFANTSGGSIFIGIADNGGVVGTLIGSESLKDWSNTISQSTEPHLIPEIEEITREGKLVVVIHIKENPLKPVSAKGRCYRRVGSGNRVMQPYEISEMHQRAIGSSWDFSPVPHATLSDLDLDRLSFYIKKANETGRRDIASDESSLNVLKKIGLIRDNVPTWAAVMLFGKNLQIFLPQATIHCGLFGSDEISVLDDRMVQGSVIEQVDDAMEFIRKNIRVAFVMTGEPERKQVWDYPVEALREAVINAVCHRDYTISSSVEIRIMEDSLTVWSPGRLAFGITLPELFVPHSSVLRNKGVAQIFYDIAWIERWGSGIQKIRTACAEAGLPEPVFQEEQGFSVVFRKDIFNAEALGQQGLNARQIQAVAYIREHGKITNSQFQILASIKKRQATKDLTDLEERQVISRIGKTGKGTHYIFKGAPKEHKGQ